jgi:hypothetical protein
VVGLADRIEREIEEILKKIDDFVPEKPRSVRKRPADTPAPAPAFENPSRASTPRSPGTSGSLSRVSLNQVMGWSLIAVLVAFFLPIPGSGWVILAALLVFGVAFLLSRIGGGSGRKVEKRWRGEPLDLSGPSLPTRIRDWIKGRRRR